MSRLSQLQMTQCQCHVIQEMKAEISEVKVELRNLYGVVHSLFEAFTHANIVVPSALPSPEEVQEEAQNLHNTSDVQSAQFESQSAVTVNISESNDRIAVKQEPFDPDLSIFSGDNSHQEQIVENVATGIEMVSEMPPSPDQQASNSILLQHLEESAETRRNQFAQRRTLSFPLESHVDPNVLGMSPSMVASTSFLGLTASTGRRRRRPRNDSEIPYIPEPNKKKRDRKKEKETERMKDRFCTECQKKICWNWRVHVASTHLAEPALKCEECEFQCKWNISQLKQHFLKFHPGLPLKFIDKRQEKEEEIRKIGEKIIILC